MTTAIVIVSHTPRLAEGVCELAAQMAPDVTLRAVGGTDDGRIGTSVDRVAQAVRELLDTAEGVVLLTDMGSATMTAELVLEMLGEDRAVLADGPLVEGAVAAAVAAQTGAAPTEVRAAAEEAALTFPAAQRGTQPIAADDQGQPAGAADQDESAGAADPGEPVELVLELRNELGLHARPAAMLARLVAGFDAEVDVNGADGASVLALMTLDLSGGAEMTVRATGPQAEQVVNAVAQIVEDRFGEE